MCLLLTSVTQSLVPCVLTEFSFRQQQMALKSVYSKTLRFCSASSPTHHQPAPVLHFPALFRYSYTILFSVSLSSYCKKGILTFLNRMTDEDIELHIYRAWLKDCPQVCCILFLLLFIKPTTTL